MDTLRSEGSGSSSFSLSRQESWNSCEQLQKSWYSCERLTAATPFVLFLCLLAQASGDWFTAGVAWPGVEALTEAVAVPGVEALTEAVAVPGVEALTEPVAVPSVEAPTEAGALAAGGGIAKA